MLFCDACISSKLAHGWLFLIFHKILQNDTSLLHVAVRILGNTVSVLDISLFIDKVLADAHLHTTHLFCHRLFIDVYVLDVFLVHLFGL